MNRRWLVRKANPEYVRHLSQTASVSTAFSQVLLKRGLTTADDIREFLSAGITNLSDPFDFPDMGIAVSRIKDAFRRGEKILVHGDYDADGLTATAIMVSALKTMGMNVDYFIPNRLNDGYGFNPPAVESALRSGTKLIITVDCGISSFEAVANATRKGLDVIITDHHEPARDQETSSPLLPKALAVVDPKIASPDRRDSELSGAGVAFKVVQACALDKDLPLTIDDALSLLDLAALGTAADVVPLTGENRIILKEGLKQILNPQRPGMKSLLAVSGLSERILNSRTLSFGLVPRINAPGRIGNAADVLMLLLSGSEDETLTMAETINKLNTERQRIEEVAYQEALQQLRGRGYEQVIVLDDNRWHIGIVGIIASRIAEEFYRPTFVFSVRDGLAKGSARSIPAFDIHRGLSECHDLLHSFGGHRQAAGVRLPADRLPEFMKRINSTVSNTLSAEDFIPTLELDTEIGFPQITSNLVKEISLLEPLGHGNPEPVFGARRLSVQKARIVGNNHLKMRLGQRSLSFDAIGFAMGGHLRSVETAQEIDAAFTPGLNEWNGSRMLQLNLRDIRVSG